MMNGSLGGPQSCCWLRECSVATRAAVQTRGSALPPGDLRHIPHLPEVTLITSPHKDGEGRELWSGADMLGPGLLLAPRGSPVLSGEVLCGLCKQGSL